MKKKWIIGISVLLIVSLFGCIILHFINERKLIFKRNGYVGKYTMVEALKMPEKEYMEFLETIKGDKSKYQEGYMLKEEGLSFADLDIIEELFCIEITESQDVNMCVGGLANKKAKLVKNGRKSFIQLDKKLINTLGDRILLGEKDVGENHYLTFEVDKNKRVYFKKLEDKKVESIIELISDNTFDLRGVFEIDLEIEERETGQDIRFLWGSSYKKYGSSLIVNNDKTGYYRIGKSEYQEFKLEQDGEKYYMEIKGDEKVERYQVITRDIDDNTYIFVDKGYGQYWKILDKDAVVFYMPNGEVYIWH